MADVVEQQSEGTAEADVWSRLILELHGILAGGGASVQLRPFWNSEGNEAEMGEAEMKVESQGDESPAAKESELVALKEDKPVKLKLVLPIGDGAEKEFEIGEFNVSLDREGNGIDSLGHCSTP